MSWVAAGVTAVGVGYGIYSDIRAKNKAKIDSKRLLGENHEFNIDPNYQANKDLIAAQKGLDAESLNFYKTQSERALTAANQASLDAGGGVNAIQKNYELSLRGFGDLSSKNAMLKRDDLKALLDANVALAGQNTMDWAIRYKQWKDGINADNNQINASNQSIASGIMNLGQIAGNAYNASNSSNSGNKNSNDSDSGGDNWQNNNYGYINPDGTMYNPNKGLK